MKVIRALLSFLIGFVLMILITVSLLCFSLQQSILKPYSTNTYLDKSGIFKAMEQNIPLYLQTNMQKDSSQEQMVDAITLQVSKQNMTEAWYKNMSNQIQTQIWDYILGKTTTLRKIDISDIKNAFTQDAKDRIESERLPYGTNTQAIIDNLVQQFPAQFDWQKTFNIDKNSLDQAKNFYEFFNERANYLVVSILVLILFGCLIKFNAKNSLKWLGKISVISGLLSMLLYFPWSQNNSVAIAQHLNFSGPLSHFETSVANLIQVIFADLFHHMFIGGIFVFAIGLILLLCTRIRLINDEKI